MDGWGGDFIDMLSLPSRSIQLKYRHIACMWACDQKMFSEASLQNVDGFSGELRRAYIVITSKIRRGGRPSSLSRSKKKSTKNQIKGDGTRWRFSVFFLVHIGFLMLIFCLLFLKANRLCHYKRNKKKKRCSSALFWRECLSYLLFLAQCQWCGGWLECLLLWICHCVLGALSLSLSKQYHCSTHALHYGWPRVVWNRTFLWSFVASIHNRKIGMGLCSFLFTKKEFNAESPSVQILECRGKDWYSLLRDVGWKFINTHTLLVLSSFFVRLLVCLSFLPFLT